MSIDDQSNEVGYGKYFGATSDFDLQFAQVVTIRGAGRLVEVRMQVFCRNPADEPVVAIHSVASDGTPSATKLADTVRKEAMPAHRGNLEFESLPLITPIRVEAGARLALVVSAPMSTDDCMLESAKSDVYSGGDPFRMSPDVPTWMRGIEDFNFQVLIAP